jgi:hypothetical protein
MRPVLDRLVRCAVAAISADVRFVVVGGVAAAAHGSAHVTNDLDICYDVAPDNLARLATLLARWDAYPRGVEQGLPFFMDERQLRTTPLMTLTTREGNLDVLDQVAGVGDYAKALEQSVEFEAFGVRFPTLDLPALIKAKRVRHDGNRVLRNHWEHVSIKRDDAGRIRPVRPKKRSKHIDGVVATLMANKGLMMMPPKKKSVGAFFV